MLIGFDGTPLGELKTGVGHYTFELARALAALHPDDQFEMVSHRAYVEAATAGLDTGLNNLRTVFVPVNRLTRHWWTVGLPAYLKKNNYTLFHGTNFDVPLRGRCPGVLTIHDLSTLLYPETHEARAARRARRRLPLMARQARVIITPTESVRREVCARLRVPPHKVVAIHEAPRALFQPLSADITAATRERLRLTETFILCVGTLEPRKNLLCLLEAFAEVASRLTDEALPVPDLVLTGRTGWLNEGVVKRIEESRFRQHIKLTGYLSDEDLCALYSSCLMVVYPSLYEGFGLPPLEAMACGAPVITSRIASIVEVVGTSAARLIEPTDTVALAKSIYELATVPRARLLMREAGLRRVTAFTWAATAQETYEVYREVLSREKGEY